MGRRNAERLQRQVSTRQPRIGRARGVLLSPNIPQGASTPRAAGVGGAPLRAVMSITAEVLDSPGPLWASVQGPAQQAGLVTVILDDLEPFRGLPGYRPSPRPWESGELAGVGDTRLEDFEDGDVFRERWKTYVPLGSLPEAERPPDPFAKFVPGPSVLEEDPGETAHFPAQVAPWGVPFPGLALAERVEIDPAVYQRAVEATASGRIGLVPADRPADVAYRTGWQGASNHFMGSREVQEQGPALLSVMMRSWEDRFDARLLRLGFDTMVQRPPMSE
jgi:hypothetical protein